MAILIEVIALIIVNSIYLAVVINHATQCEMIIFYVNEIRTRLEEKSVTIKIIPFFQMLEDVGYKLKLNFFGGGGQK